MKEYLNYSAEMDSLTLEENQLLDRAVESISTAVKLSAEINGKRTRRFHAKTHAGVVGKFIPEYQDSDIEKLSPFPKSEISVLARFSNAESKITPDKLSLPAYGISLKFTDNSGFEANFPMVNFPIFVTNSVKDLLNVLISANDLTISKEKDSGTVKSTLEVLKNFAGMSINNGLGQMFDLMKKGLSIKKDFLLNADYHTIGCYRFGDKVCKFRIIPTEKFEVENPEEITQQDMLEKVFANQEVTLLFEIQISESEELQPVNDLMQEWPDHFTTIGKLVFPVQKIISSENTELEKTDFTPFANPEGLLPVGRIQHTRLRAYKASFEARKF